MSNNEPAAAPADVDPGFDTAILEIWMEVVGPSPHGLNEVGIATLTDKRQEELRSCMCKITTKAVMSGWHRFSVRVRDFGYIDGSYRQQITAERTA